MKISLRLTNVLGLIATVIVSSGLCGAAVIYDSGISALTNSDPLQEGRLFRDGNPSSWATQKAFPGITTPDFGYLYNTYTLTNVLYPYIQVTIDDVAGTGLTFASAYLGSYYPNARGANNGLDINYLGDAGASGNYFGTDPRAFQVIAPVHDTLVVVVNGTGTAAVSAVGQPYRILVEGFTDTSFDDTIPEPASVGLTGSALAGVTIAIFLRRRKLTSN